MIGIISYLPDDNELREVRYKAVFETIEFLHRVFSDEVINVVDQNWNASEREKFDYVRFYCIDNGISLPKARNLMLEEFYNSTDTWMVMSDDDVILYDYYGAEEFLQLLYQGEFNNYPMDLIVPLSPQLSPFKQKLLDADVENYYSFTPSRLTDIPNFLVLRNAHDHILYNEELDTRTRKEMISEDAEFIMQQMLKGKKCVVADFMIKKNLAYNNSTIFPEESQNDYTFHKKLNEALKLYIRKHYNIDSRYFTKYYNKATSFTIRRKERYILPENLSTVTKRNRKKQNDTVARRLF